jgi:deoxyribonuclease IV
MGGLLFGTGGVPLSARQRSTISGIERIKELGLGCMEIEFVQGITMSPATADSVRIAGNRARIALSCHAPYFINLNSREPEKVRASERRLIQTAQVAQACGVRTVVFHAAFYMNETPEKTYDIVKERMKSVLSEIKTESKTVTLRPEVTGKPTQFGTIAELLQLCKDIPELLPCIDLAHWHARTRAFNTYGEVLGVLKHVDEALGRRALDDMHFHFSGIKYGLRGELSHLPLKESDFNYVEIMRGLVEYDVKGLVICESPNLEEDALLLQQTYNDLVRAKAAGK